MWCQGRNWQIRILFLVWFLYVLVKYWTDPLYGCLLSALNLGIHELGHFVFYFFGNFIGTLGGTLLQLIAPFFAVINFYRQSDFFAIALSFGWLSTNFFDIARYVADARALELPLVSPFGISVIHDWNYLLSKIGLLQYDIFLAGVLKFFAAVSMFICFFLGIWLLWQMKKSNVTTS